MGTFEDEAQGWGEGYMENKGNGEDRDGEMGSMGKLHL